jgi:hypothetical protein
MASLVKHITYKGKEHPVRISYRAIKVLTQSGKNIDAENLLSGQEDSDMYEKILFIGLQSGYKAEDITDFPFKESDMEDVLDEIFWEFLEIMPEFFPEKMRADIQKEMSLGKNRPEVKETRRDRRKRERNTN